MAVDMFLKIDGIEGESADSKHKGEVEILSFSWGISDASRTQNRPGKLSRARRTSLSDFSIVKQLDSASPALFEKCCQGGEVSEVSFVARKSGESQLEYYKIKLTDVLISSVAPAGSTGGNTMEQVSFSFGSAEIYAAKQDATGKIIGSTTTLCGASAPDLEEER